MARERVFGAIPGISEGAMFANRREASIAGVHRPTIAGISGSGKAGADSIVLNGGYVDDEDYGDLIIYTGEGGQDNTGRQVEGQRLTKGNLALKVSADEALSVRVIRGAKGDQFWSPNIGYRYDGLYQVVRIWREVGIHGHHIWRFKLERLGQPLLIETSNQSALRQVVISERLIRDTGLALRVKEIHDYACQVCGERLESPGGPYAEAAHIKPLGRPDDGPDIESNIICVCPNHHKLLDAGGIVVDEDWKVICVIDGQVLGELARNRRHRLSQEFLTWHRQRWTST